MEEQKTYHNVFDDPQEFQKLNGLLLGAIDDFTKYRDGNVTYGEIMYVMECILDSLRNTSEKDALKSEFSKSLGETPSFSHLLAVNSRLVETLLKNRVISTDDELYVLHGQH